MGDLSKERETVPAYQSPESRAIEALALVVVALTARVALLEAETATVRLVWGRDIVFNGSGACGLAVREAVRAANGELYRAERAAESARVVVGTLAATGRRKGGS